jgi:two-component system, sensor histidine kinase and response regulator
MRTQEIKLQATSSADHPDIRILLVDDSLVNRLVILGQLKRLGHTAIVATDGYEAIEAASATPFDIVLMDCEMPRMNGYQATLTLREHERQEQGSPHARVVAMTAHDLVGDREKCLAAGMDDYLRKPVQTEELRVAIERWQAISELA